MDRGAVHDIEFGLNGEARSERVSSRQLFVHFLRDDLGLRGPKIGCDTGHCGACTVRYNGKTIKSCMMLAIQADGAQIATVEAMSVDGDLNELQESFRQHHGLQTSTACPGSRRTLLRRLREAARDVTPRIRPT